MEKDLAASEAPTGAPTLRDLLVGNALAINLIRLMLALLVLAHHADYLGGYGDGLAWPTLGDETALGTFAVGGFFVLSGMLVTMSGVRRTPYEFLRSRVLRIVPAYVAVIVLCALVLAPIVWWDMHGSLSGYWNTDPGGPFAYVVHDVWFPMNLQYGINDVFPAPPVDGQPGAASVINGSLWTLPLEVRAYLVALFIVLLGRGLGLTRVAVVALAYVSALLFLYRTAPEIAGQIAVPWLAATELQELMFVFLVGAVLGTRADTLRVRPALVVVAAAIFVLASLQGGTTFRTVGLASLAILLPMLASLLPAARLRVFRHDLSYGTYLWAFPVQQTLVYLGLASVPFLFVTVGAGATLVVAALSWFCIERPALRLRRSRMPAAVEAEAEERADAHQAAARVPVG